MTLPEEPSRAPHITDGGSLLKGFLRFTESLPPRQWSRFFEHRVRVQGKDQRARERHAGGIEANTRSVYNALQNRLKRKRNSWRTKRLKQRPRARGYA